MTDKIYPNFEYGNYDDGISYYVEFDRGNRGGEFTLFQRSFIHSKEMYAQIMSMASENEKFWLKQSAEGHPYNLFTGTYGCDSCYPNKEWVKWMVDALNEKTKNNNK